MKTLYCLAILVVALAVYGCGSSEEASNTGKTTVAPGATPKVGDTVNGTKIVSKPPSEIPEGGIMLQPENPNDPRFKPDPKLNGGG